METQAMAHGARVLIIESPDTTSASRARELRELGLDTISVPRQAASRLMELAGGRPDFAVVDALAIDPGIATDRFLGVLAREGVPALLIGTPAQATRLPRDFMWHEVIHRVPSSVFLANRIHAALRLNALRAEFDRRVETCARYGVDAPHPVRMPPDIQDPAMLVLGPGKEFGAIDDALSDTARIVGAFSPAMATEYLSMGKFDLVIADMGVGIETVCDLAGDLRRDSRFQCIPLLLVGAPEDDGLANAALKAGVTEVLAAPLDTRILRSRALALAREQRFSQSLKQVFEDARHLVGGDALTGLYTRGFLMAHLDGLLTDDTVRFTLAVFEIADIATVNAAYGYAEGDRLIRQIGMMLGRLLRGEDLPARLHGARFAAILIDTDRDAAEAITRRMSAFVRTTRFVAGEKAATLEIDLRVGLAAPVGGTTPDRLIADALGALR